MGLSFNSFGDLPVWFLQYGSIYDVLNQWESFGVFDFILPFLLIFSIVFAVLASTNILGGNKGISVIIALVISLLALRLDFVTIFFAELFPRFALGLVSLILAVILIGLFIPKEAAKGWYIAFGIVGAIIAVVVVLQTFSNFDYFGSEFWQRNAGIIVTSVLIAAAIIGVIVSVNNKNTNDITIPIAQLRN